MAKSTALQAIQLLNAADPDTHPPFPSQCPVLYIDQAKASLVGVEKNVLEEDMSRILIAWLSKTLIFKLTTLVTVMPHFAYRRN